MAQVFLTRNQDKHHLFQKINGAGCKIYSAIMFAEKDLEIDAESPEILEMKKILVRIEKLGDDLIGKERADHARKNEYAQQKLSRGEI